MQELIFRLQDLLDKGEAVIMTHTSEVLKHRISGDKWSKQEIIGHLIDSAINNLQRFTEIRFLEKPYAIRKYNQVELVKANGYQNARIADLLDCWVSLNNHIIHLIGTLRPEELAYEIILDEDEKTDLRFLVKDYVDHMEHHLIQIGILPR